MFKTPGPSKKPIFLLLLFISLSTVVFAQSLNYSIEWKDSIRTTQLNDYKNHQVVTFSGCVFSYQKYGTLPLFVKQFEVGNYGTMAVNIVNAVYAPLTAKESNLVKQSENFIQSAPAAEAVIIEARLHHLANLIVLPFRKSPSTGEVEKLVSFGITYTIEPDAASQSKKITRGPAYASNSVLATGTWFKLPVDLDGVYKIDKAYLKTLGISIDNIDPRNIRIYGNGGGMLPEANSAFRYDDLQENAIYVSGESDGKFDDADYILFYGESPNQWNYDTLSQKFTHKQNIYSDLNYYFLTYDQGAGKRVTSIPSLSQTPNVTVNSFDDYQCHESDLTNIDKTGREWYGEDFQFNTDQTFPFSFPNIDCSKPVRVKVEAAARSLNGNRTFTVTGIANGSSQVLGTIPLGATVNDDNHPYATGGNNTGSFTTCSASNTIEIKFGNPANDADGWLNYIELQATRQLTFNSTQLEFRSAASRGAGNISQFNITNANSTTWIWDITDATNVGQQLFTVNGSIASFTAATPILKQYIAFNPTGSFYTPKQGSKVTNQNLHSIAQVDYIIVCPPDFNSAASQLAAFHQTAQNFKTVVVSPAQIYNEFSSGAQDITAIRDFMRMLYKRAQTNGYTPPAYMLLLGDASYDYKNRVQKNTNIVPVYESPQSIDQVTTFCTDDYYGILDDNEGGSMTAAVGLDVNIGRIPADNADEALTAVNKIKSYSASCNFGNWQNNYTMVTDDEEGNTFLSDAEDILSSVKQYKVWNIDKIYLAAYQQISTPSGQRAPQVNTAITNKIYNGTLMINYVGHGGVSGWAQERILQIADVNGWTNGSKLPLFITATCEFSKFDDPELNSIGEMLEFKVDGGAIALVTTVRLVYEWGNKQLNTAFTKRIFEPYNNYYHTLGEAFTLSKNDVITPQYNSDPTNARKFMLIGDPAIYLAYPHDNTITTEVNGKPYADGKDTLKALEKVTIKGQIRDRTGNLITSFNGRVYPTVFDKTNKIKTFADNGTEATSFPLQNSILYKGKASVTNGLFTFTFIVPKDINYKFDFGKLSFYAEDGKTDANGYKDSIVVGGVSDTFNVDKKGPQAKLYMNDQKFVFGGITDPNPAILLLLKDESGINTTGNGIGHDLTGVLDGNTQASFVMNDFYTANQDDYTSGQVRYPLKSLAEGHHTLDVKAWDVYNNASTSYTEFIVASTAKLALEHVLNYPNPFTSNTEFMFEHNMPGANLNISIEIYTMSGKLIKTIRTNNLSASAVQGNSQCCSGTASTTGGYRVDGIMWDGKDDFGDPIGKGVYIYRVGVRTDDGLKADKYEKLVLLK